MDPINVTAAPSLEIDPSVSRFEILKFMLACEQFLAFVRLNGGVAALTMDERQRIMTYQKLLSALMLQQANPDDTHV
jgi:hypothetical protein